MCLLNFEKFQQNKNILNREKKWTYENQANWRTYQNYYSTIRTPINIEKDKVIKLGEKCEKCEKSVINEKSIINEKNVINEKIVINYNDGVEGIVTNEHLTPYFLPKTTDNYISYCDKKYILSNYHIHCSSENTIDNLYYPIEVHFVNIYTNPETSKTEHLILSLMLFISENVGLQIVNFDYENIKNEGDEYDKIVNLKFLNELPTNSYYNFLGTLTTPPFDQNFNWNLFDSADVKNIPLFIKRDNFNNLIYYFSNNKSNEQSLYNDTRYIMDINNYSVIKKID